MLLLVSQA